jgi:hypothetical protein
VAANSNQSYDNLEKHLKTSSNDLIHTATDAMASMIARRAALSSKAFSSRTFTTSARRMATDPTLKDETKRNPELYVRHIPIMHSIASDAPQ